MASAAPVLTKRTAGATTNADVTALLRARNTLLWVMTREEVRVERGLLEAATAAKFSVVHWDCAQGFSNPDGSKRDDNDETMRSPNAAVDYIKAKDTERAVYVMRDLHAFLRDPILLRQLRNLSRELETVSKDKGRAVIIMSPTAEVPPELGGHVTVIDYPLPDRAEIEGLLCDVIAALPDELRATVTTTETFQEAVDAAVGLTAQEAASCYARSLVTSKKIDPALVSAEKKRVIAKEKVLTWYDPDPRGIAAIGGLDVLKGWLAVRHTAFTPEARAFGIPAPKGVMLVGIPGCGKSLTAKCIASAWGMPLLRLDMGALRSKWVGESEGNIRKALKVAETVAPCVLWLDEIEKALAGSTGGQGDGGIAADALGSILSWMQERVGAVFVVATANDVSALPPELLRKGRFDELFFVDVPNRVERVEILRASLGGRKLPEDDVQKVVAAMPDFTGAEIAACVPEALFRAFNDGGRALTADDLITTAKQVVPLAKTMAPRIKELREWAQGKARNASTAEQQLAGSARQLDLG